MICRFPSEIADGTKQIGRASRWEHYVSQARSGQSSCKVWVACIASKVVPGASDIWKSVVGIGLDADSGLVFIIATN